MMGRIISSFIEKSVSAPPKLLNYTRVVRNVGYSPYALDVVGLRRPLTGAEAPPGFLVAPSSDEGSGGSGLHAALAGCRTCSGGLVIGHAYRVRTPCCRLHPREAWAVGAALCGLGPCRDGISDRTMALPLRRLLSGSGGAPPVRTPPRDSPRPTRLETGGISSAQRPDGSN